ncbi:MAG: heavy-metal-associated domain-containing protein [Actinobacteria bacterium]|nr:heavy-metal-associated domain-containing protein [Actinomycetota bacterium]
MTMTYAVPGISCDHCVHAITGEVEKLDGVRAVHVDVATKTVTVDGDVAEAAVRAAIDEAGYDVESVSTS